MLNICERFAILIWAVVFGLPILGPIIEQNLMQKKPKMLNNFKPRNTGAKFTQCLHLISFLSIVIEAPKLA